MRANRIPHYLILAAALCAGPVHAAPAGKSPPRAAPSGPAGEAIALAIRDQAGGVVKSFYADRGFRPLWAAGGRIGRSADTLIGYLRSADADGLRPSSYNIDDLSRAVAAARGGDARAIARAELDLSAAFARYVQDQRRSGVRMTYADRRLKPKRLGAETVLRAASFPKSLDDYVADMGWMSTQYVGLRALALRAQKQGLAGDRLARLHLNLDRARLLPGPYTRHIVVDASSGRLWYYELGRQVGTMRVVVGAKETQTPMLVGTLQWAVLNPYWNIPTYLARNSIAPKVLAGRSLAAQRIEALSGWSADARRIPASEIDWSAVASGKREVRLRELPGGANSMGRVKFMFPNDEGIYLHDTPARDLLKKEDRHFSNGCIRLENAAELGKWLLRKPLSAASKQPEQAVPLPVPVPVYLTYITAAATDKGIAFRPDVYGRDD